MVSTSTAMGASLCMTWGVPLVTSCASIAYSPSGAAPVMTYSPSSSPSSDVTLTNASPRSTKEAVTSTSMAGIANSAGEEVNSRVSSP